MNSEDVVWAARKMEESANRAQSAADRIEAAAHRIALLLEDGYGGNGLLLLEALQSAAKEAKP